MRATPAAGALWAAEDRTGRTGVPRRPGDPRPFGAAHQAKLTIAQCLGTVLRKAKKRGLRPDLAATRLDHRVDLEDYGTAVKQSAPDVGEMVHAMATAHQPAARGLVAIANAGTASTP